MNTMIELPKILLFWFYQFLRTAVLLLWIVFRPALRFIGAVLMVAAVFALTADVTRWQIGETVPLFHSLAYHIASMAPATFKRMAETLGTSYPIVWDYGLSAFLSAPAWFIFALLSVALVIAGRERRRIDIFIN